MTDIVERLRRMATIQFAQYDHDAIKEAADQIEGLRDELRNAYRERDEASRDWERAMRRIAELEAQLASRAVPEPTDDELSAFAEEEQFLLFCDTDEFIDIARAVLYRFAAAPQPETPAPAPSVPAEVEGERIYQHWCRELIAALKRLSFAAQTTGGTAGRDDELCKSIDQAEKALSLTAASRAIDSAEVEGEREAFEVWATEKGFSIDCSFFEEGNNFESPDTRMAYEIWQAARAQLGAVPEPHPVFKFLLGEGDLEGLWFGDRCDGRPAFWWRHHLRAALAAQPTQEQPHD